MCNPITGTGTLGRKKQYAKSQLATTMRDQNGAAAVLCWKAFGMYSERDYLV